MSRLFSNGDWDVEGLIMEGFRNGSIVRVSMLNFLTFYNCEVFPGPRLNVILGPNGTGKSSITHAICLACGGKPESIGRSSDVKEFVKNDRQGQMHECYVEVDLLNYDDVVAVRRNLSYDSNQSKYSINGKSVPLTAVQQLMAKLRIDCNNLCSFMSQDRVGKFTRENAKGILQRTLQSIIIPGTDKTLYAEQLELIELQSDHRGTEKIFDAKQATSDDLMSQLTNMRGEYERSQARQTNKVKLDQYEFKLIVQQGKELKQELTAQQSTLNAAVEALEAAKMMIHPLEAKERSLKKDVAMIDKSAATYRNTLASSNTTLTNKRSKIEDTEVNIDTAKSDLENFAVDLKTLERSLHTEKNHRSQLEEQLQRCRESLPVVEDKMRENKAMITELKDKIDECRDSLRENNGLCSNNQTELDQIQNELKSFVDPWEVFKIRLRSFDPRALSVLEYVKKNEGDWKKGGSIQNEIIGPIAMYLNVPDKACAFMLEKKIPRGKLLGWIVSCDSDRIFLSKELRKNKLSADIYTMNSSDLSSFQKPYTESELQAFKHLGMQGYLSVQFTCDDIVRAFLYGNLRMHDVIWSRSTPTTVTITQEDLSNLVRRNNRCTLYADDTRSKGQRGKETYVQEYIVAVSKYSKGFGPTTRVQQVKPARLLGEISGDFHEKQSELECRRKECIGRLKSLEETKKQIRIKEKNYNDELDKLNATKAHLSKVLQGPKTLNGQIASVSNKIQTLEARLSKDTNSSKRDKQQSYMNEVNSIFQQLDELTDIAENSVKASIDCSITDLSKKKLLDEIRVINDGIRTMTAGLEQLEADRKHAELALANTQKILDAAAVQLSNRERDMGKEKFRDLLKTVTKDLPETTIASITDRIAVYRTELATSVDNDQIVERFHQVQRSLEVVQNELMQLQSEKDKSQSGLVDRSADWVQRVKTLSDKINNSFNSFMEQLQYCGEVALNATGSYADYEMQMKVSFRAEDPLTDLNGERHSGGERAVSTIMYLMALQELTSAPFRVVDEINQGMDERNERLVIDRIVQSCCGEANRPQYFLVSPKLLQGLRSMEHEDVTILLVMNGPGVPKQTAAKWSLDGVVTALGGTIKRDRSEDSNDRRLSKKQNTGR